MGKKKTNLDDLMRTVENLRKKMCPDLDAQFLKSVIRIEEENPEEENPEEDKPALSAIRAELKKAVVARGGR
ncbi:hypothetical protein [Nannocystis radixulma]|uniref:Uncharacterized protein n=1 Tax=Nannocystis radixulma TaxID=2995305 RepID=A0ABT5BP89_9BACT|nr:hypothetical protein [Nannocystis radixulma]MDC0675980.1 hypothetical protein [Nannocystis radixulma]